MYQSKGNKFNFLSLKKIICNKYIKMNIVEAYIKFKGQLLIFVSGLSGCGKSTIGKKIASAAVGVFLPYVSSSKKDEARKKFLAAIEPLIDAEIVPQKPEDIEAIEKEVDGK